jgi:hypothetical protein
MALLDKLYQDMKDAMKAGDKPRTEVVRMLIAALKKEAIDTGALDEAAEVAAVQRAVKQRREAAEAYDKAGRQDLAQKEKDEAKILGAYLPSQLDDAQLDEAVREAVQATGATSAKDLGKVMGRLMAKYKGHVDGQRAREAITRALGGP